MPLERAEHFFRKGLACLGDDHPADAARHLLTAIQLEREHGVRKPEMRYLSYYGLALALAEGPGPEAVRACETAAEREPQNPDLRHNLARLYVLQGKRTRAAQAAGQGLLLAPDHRGIRAFLPQVERRARPAVRFLTRDHPINRVLGRVRASLRT